MKKVTTILAMVMFIVVSLTAVACGTTSMSSNIVEADSLLSESFNESVTIEGNKAELSNGVQETTDDKYVYTLNEDGNSYTLVGVSKSFADEYVVIPATHNGKPVTIIEEYAFQECNSIIMVTIPDSIIEIREGAFASCERLGFVKFGNNPQFNRIEDYTFASCGCLLNVTIPASVTEIGQGAFYNCDNLSNIYYLGSENEWSAIAVDMENEYLNDQARVHYHNELETCDLDFAFSLNEDGESYTLDFIDESFMGKYVEVPATHNGKPVTVIGTFALFSERFETIILPEGITMIGSNAFDGAKTLSTIVIPRSVNIIGTDAFKDCVALRDMYYLGTIEEWEEMFVTNNIILTGLTPHMHGIDDECVCSGYEFELNRDGRSYMIVGVNNLFKGGDVVLPETFNGMPVTKIADEAFYSCENVTSVVIPDSYTTIGRGAFSYCESLKSIYVGKNVTYIGKDSFISPIEGIEVNPENLTFKSIDGNLYTKDGAVLLQYACGNPALTFRVPDGVTTIADEACIFAFNMIRVIIPESVKQIGYGAFGECYNLADVVFEGNCQITEIPDYCFAWTDLRELTIPSSITQIGFGAFDSCIELYEVCFADNSQLVTIGEDAFYNCVKLRYVDFGDNSSLTTIGVRAFADCGNLHSVNFGENSQLETIGAHAFYKSGLQQISIPDSVITINRAFEGSWKLDSVFFGAESQLKDMSCAFNGCMNLRYITIPEGVTDISGAFVDCISLERIEIPESVTDMGGAFRGCTSLVEVNIPENIKDLGMWTFRDCESLEYIVIPDSVETIGLWAFGNCKSLETVYVYEGCSIKTLENGVFDGCTSFRNIELPSTLEYIGAYVFRDCDSLTDIWYDGTEEDWNAIECYDYEQFEGKTIRYMR